MDPTFNGLNLYQPFRLPGGHLDEYFIKIGTRHAIGTRGLVLVEPDTLVIPLDPQKIRAGEPLTEYEQMLLERLFLEGFVHFYDPPLVLQTYSRTVLVDHLLHTRNIDEDRSEVLKLVTAAVDRGLLAYSKGAGLRITKQALVLMIQSGGINPSSIANHII